MPLDFHFLKTQQYFFRNKFNLATLSRDQNAKMVSDNNTAAIKQSTNKYNKQQSQTHS